MSHELNQVEAQNDAANEEIKQHFINDAKYALLRKYQQLIFEKTEVSPSVKRLTNALITEENLKRISEKLIYSLTNQED